MNTKFLKQSLSISQSLRWGAEASGILLVVGWVAFVCAELVRTQFEIPARGSFYQAAALLVVFTGYAFLWRHLLVGSALAIIGTGIYFAINWMTFGLLPGWDAVLFAIPGVLALLAWSVDRRCGGAT